MAVNNSNSTEKKKDKEDMKVFVGIKLISITVIIMAISTMMLLVSFFCIVL